MSTPQTGRPVLPAPPEQLRALDFLLGHNECVGRPRPDGSPPTVMHMHGTPALGGSHLQVDVTWPGTMAGRWTFGWNPVDGELGVHYIADSGSRGSGSSPGWRDGELVVTGHYAVVELNAHRYVRDVFHRIDDDHFVSRSYARATPEEEWRPIDVFECHRVGDPAAW
ncbi:hypothetical protein [Saccharothrix xinjiangensis]|uniref:Uncharacterized protein n=1 Tax=Saccharothrix xinjiangensis TaxID=204798 RepID=A0ABV9XZU8_9PSEU